jgi:hypothetical protein
VLIDPKPKKFDCVRMKRLGAAKVRQQTANLSREQELHFWQERSQHLRQRQTAPVAHISTAATTTAGATPHRPAAKPGRTQS